MKTITKQIVAGEGDAVFRVVVNCRQKAGGWAEALPRARAIATRCTAAALTAAGIVTSSKAVRELEISLVLADDAFQQKLNREYRGKDQPTNILSFPGLDAAALLRLRMPPLSPDQEAEILLGDLIVAFETVVSEALAAQKSLKDHFSHLVVHGLLHLIGYDHENDAEAADMERLETEILAGLGIEDPYQ